jgi:uncharacterized protein YkwD
MSAPEPTIHTAPPPPPSASSWAEATRSPQVAAVPADTRQAELASACGVLDAALGVAALQPAEDIEAQLRELGSPAVRVRVLTVHGTGSDDALKAKLQAMRTMNTRCGVGTNGDATVVVSAEFLADLDTLPTRSRTGSWLPFSARLNVPAATAKLVVLGPRGLPKTFPTTVQNGRVSARFVLDRAGAFTVQLLADVAGGPRPLLEANVFADVAPTRSVGAAPGEEQPDLERMVAATRRDEGLAALKRDARLDALAEAHAQAMAKANAVAHDLGDGDLAQRFEAQGYAASVVGENVARAATLPLAHRALYASPSHRMNLLNAQYTRIGLATVTDGPRIYVCEVFSSELR